MKQLWATLVTLCFVWLYLRSPVPATTTDTPELLGPLSDLVGMLTHDLVLAIIYGTVLTGLLWIASKFFSNWWR